MPFTKETAKLYGKVGGRNLVKKYGSVHMAKLGAAGGKAMLEKGGREFYSKIGSIQKSRKEDNGV